MTAASIAVTETGIQVSFDAEAPGQHLDIDRCVHDLRDLREAMAALKIYEGVYTEFLSDALGRNGIDVEGVGHVEIKHGTKRTAWDRRDLLRAVLDSRRPPSPDGEASPSDDGQATVDDELVTCSQDLARVLDVWNLGSPRVTALRDRGIDPDQYAEVTYGQPTVVLS